MVETWHSKFAHRLRLYSLMPVRLEGHLTFPPYDSPPRVGPKLMWHPRVLQSGEQSEAVFELGDPSFNRADDDTYFSEESEAFARLRHQHARDAPLFRVASLMVDEVLEPRPGTRLACGWLIDDLRNLKWER